MRKKYEISVAKAGPFGTHLNPDGIRQTLGYSDVPKEFRVGTDGPILRVEFAYQADNIEDRRQLEHGPVVFELGTHSQRLFAVSLNLDATIKGKTGQRMIVDAVAGFLRTALDWVTQTSKSSGSRMNYRVAQAGLALDVPTTPPDWLMEAMNEHWRSPRSSRPT